MFVMNWEQPNLEIQEIINNFKIDNISQILYVI